MIRSKELKKRVRSLPAHFKDYDVQINSSPAAQSSPLVQKRQRIITEESTSSESSVTIVGDSETIRTPGHYYLNSGEDIQQFSSLRGVRYVIPHRPCYKKTQRDLKIAPTSILTSSVTDQTMGVYTTKPIWVAPGREKVLGVYHGNTVTDSAEVGNSSFVFELPDGNLYDASEQCNWTAMVNGALSDHACNLKIRICPTVGGKFLIEYYLEGGEHGVYLQTNTQLLVTYGSTAKYDDFHNGKKYISSRDGFLDTLARFESYNSYNVYNESSETLPAEFLRIFAIPAGTRFAIPSASDVAHCFDVPFLQYNRRGKFIAANQQENITPLMLACWQGRLAKVTSLLRDGANPNIQTSNAGLSALHMVVLSPTSMKNKIKILQALRVFRKGMLPTIAGNEQILDLVKDNLTLDSGTVYWHNQGDLTLQDEFEKTLVHFAIENNDPEMVSYLLDNEQGFWDFQDCNGNDPLEFAIINANIDCLNSVLAAIDNLRVSNEEKFIEVCDYLLSNEKGDKNIRLLSALKCFYNSHKGNNRLLDQVTYAVDNVFNDILSTTHKRQITTSLTAAKEPNRRLGDLRLFKQAENIDPEQGYSLTLRN